MGYMAYKSSACTISAAANLVCLFVYTIPPFFAAN